MEGEKSVSVTISGDLAELVDAKVAAGEYDSEADVLRAGLAMLAEREAAVDDWLHVRVEAAYDRHVSDPGRALSAVEPRRSLALIDPDRT